MTIPRTTDSHQRPRARVTFPAGAPDTEWRPFVPASRHAVYVLTDAAGGVLYVGQTKQPGARLRNHYRNQPWWPEVTGIELHLVAGEIEGRQLEAELIGRLRPLHSVVTPFDVLRLTRLVGGAA